MEKLYTILKQGKYIKSSIPGEYAGWAPGKIFGRLDCKSGMRMKKENRVFFHTLKEAILEGYRPCKNCKPINEKDFIKIRHLAPLYQNLVEFYNRDDKPKP
jgi:methylphosphotriester-DNA--protein-cysteine methyltransferase